MGTPTAWMTSSRGARRRSPATLTSPPPPARPAMHAGARGRPPGLSRRSSRRGRGFRAPILRNKGPRRRGPSRRPNLWCSISCWVLCGGDGSMSPVLRPSKRARLRGRRWTATNNTNVCRRPNRIVHSRPVERIALGASLACKDWRALWRRPQVRRVRVRVDLLGAMEPTRV